MTTVIPAIIPKDKKQLEEEIKLVAGFADIVQVDISDGLFTPVKTWPYNGNDADFFEKLKTQEVGWPMWQDVNIEVHLMIKNPEDVISDWINSGVSSVVVHIEAINNFQKIADSCKEGLVTLGVAMKPSTEIQKIDKFISQIDFVQIMGSDKLGHHGVELENLALERIKELRRRYSDSIIGIDIGVTEETAKELVRAGANRLICGSAILDADNPKEVYKDLSYL